MFKNNFVLTVKFNNGSIAELFNINGLDETSVEHAINLAFDMVEKMTLENSRYSKHHANHWFDAKPHSMRYDKIELINNHKIYNGRGIHLF